MYRLSIIVPTYNERENVVELYQRIEKAMGPSGWELVFVDDDSPDGTAATVRDTARVDPRVRVIQRIGRRGLSSACIEGVLGSSAPTLAVMDADLQHDETRLPVMLDEIESGRAELVIATRYAAGGSTGDWNATREGMSRFATRMGNLLLKQPVSDPMSGFFMLRREVFEETVHGLSALGFKILLDILATARRPLKLAEVPYTFRDRFAGVSKLDSSVLWDFGMLLADKKFGRYVPVRFVAFAVVGGLGVFVHMAVLTVALKGLGIPFLSSQSLAAGAAMTFNFAVNNELTYRDRRLRGWRWWTGLLSFFAACSVGAVANVGVANYLFNGSARWVVAALAGIAVGAVWNYAITQIYTWGRAKA